MPFLFIFFLNPLTPYLFLSFFLSFCFFFVLVLYFNGGVFLGFALELTSPFLISCGFWQIPGKIRSAYCTLPVSLDFWRVRWLDVSVCIVVHQFGTSSHGRTLCSSPPNRTSQGLMFCDLYSFCKKLCHSCFNIMLRQKKKLNMSFKSSVVWRNCIKPFIYFSYFSIFVKPCCNIAQLQDSHKAHLRSCVGLGSSEWLLTHTIILFFCLPSNVFSLRCALGWAFPIL